MKIKGYDGLYKTIIIATSQTICQIKKYYQTRIWGIYGYMGYRGYRGIGGIRVSSLYRRISPISHIETLNVSHNKTGGYRAGYIKKYQTIPIGIYTHIWRIHGLMV